MLCRPCLPTVGLSMRPGQSRSSSRHSIKSPHMMGNWTQAALTETLPLLLPAHLSKGLRFPLIASLPTFLCYCLSPRPVTPPLSRLATSPATSPRGHASPATPPRDAPLRLTPPRRRSPGHVSPPRLPATPPPTPPRHASRRGLPATALPAHASPATASPRPRLPATPPRHAPPALLLPLLSLSSRGSDSV